jgi:benzoyl-CoA-dihydrodiol lyase
MAVSYSAVSVELDRGHASPPSRSRARTARRRPTWRALQAEGDQFWPLRLARELDDAILHLR